MTKAKNLAYKMLRRSNLENLVILSFWLTFAFIAFTTWFNRNPDRNWDKASTHSFSAEALFAGWYKKDWMPSAGGTYLWPFPDLFIEIFNFDFNPKMGNAILVLIVVLTTANLLYKISILVFHGVNNSRFYVQLALVISMLAPFWLGELGTTFSSWISAPFVLAALLCLLRISNGDNSRKTFYLLGINLGFSFALKLTNGIFVLATVLCLCLLLIFKHEQRNMKGIIGSGVGFIVGLSPIFPWWFFVYKETGNPIFPYYNSMFNSSFYPQINTKDARWEWHFPDSLLNLPTGWISGTPIVELKSVDIRLIVLFGLYLAIFGVFVIRQIVKSYLVNEVKIVPKNNLAKLNSSLPLTSVFHMWILFATLSWIFMFGFVRYWIAVELIVGIAITHLVLNLFSSGFLRWMSLISVCLVAFFVIAPPNWNDSARPGLGTPINPWESQLTSRISKASGVLMTEGSPISFLRTTNSKISTTIGLDLPNIPLRFKNEVTEVLKNYQTVYFVTTNPDLFTGVPEPVILFLEKVENLEAECEILEGPILVTYQYCEIRQIRKL